MMIKWQVVFPALDLHTKNVISTYSLEHESLDGLFTSISKHCEDINGENKDISKPFQELIFCLGTIQTTICQHMIKEEQQVNRFHSLFMAKKKKQNTKFRSQTKHSSITYDIYSL